MLYINGFSDYYDNILRQMLPDDEKYILNRPKSANKTIQEYISEKHRDGSFYIEDKYKLDFNLYMKYHKKFTGWDVPSIFILGFYGKIILFENKVKRNNYSDLITWAKTLNIPNETYLIEINQTIRNIWVDISLHIFELQNILPPNEAAYIVREYLIKQTNPEPEIQQVSDEIMAKQKGFDHKYSFRKEPTKKRNK